jgi:hypothetical protein
MSTSTPPNEITALNPAPITAFDRTLQEQFAQDVAAQAGRLDELAKQLITLQIAIPGIFAAVLKLVSGDAATAGNRELTLLAFALWLIALILTLVALFPRRREVDLDDLKAIENYFMKSAERKRLLLAIASVLTFAGIFFSVMVVFI